MWRLLYWSWSFYLGSSLRWQTSMNTWKEKTVCYRQFGLCCSQAVNADNIEHCCHPLLERTWEIVFKIWKWNGFAFWTQKVAMKFRNLEHLANEYHPCKRSDAEKCIIFWKTCIMPSAREQYRICSSKNKRFSNKSVLRSIRAKNVNACYQIDITDMGAQGTITFKRKYRYIWLI